MRIRPIDLTIYLDPIRKSEEIWDDLLESEFKDRIEPLHIWKPNQTPPTLDDEEYYKYIRGSTLKKDTSIKFTKEELRKP